MMTKLTPEQDKQVKAAIKEALKEALKVFDDEVIQSLKERVTKLEKDLVSKDNEIKQRDVLIKSLQDAAAATAAAPAAVQPNAWFKQPKAEVHILAKVRQELTESERIKKNLIISGLPIRGDSDEERTTNDEKNVDTVLSCVGLARSTVQRQVRLKCNNPDANLVLVEFKDYKDRDSALSRSGELKKISDFKRVFLNRDMTMAERLAEKELRAERSKLNEALPDKDSQGRPRGTHNGKRFYWGVRSGELRRIFDRAA